MRPWPWPAFLVVAFATAPQLHAQTADGGVAPPIVQPTIDDAGQPSDDDTNDTSREDGDGDTPFQLRLVPTEDLELTNPESFGAPIEAPPPTFETVIDDGTRDAGPAVDDVDDVDDTRRAAPESKKIPSSLVAPVDIDDPTDDVDAKPPSGTSAPPLPGEPTVEHVFDPLRCITPAEYERAKQGSKREAFGTSSIPLGPFFWATRDRTLVQAMLVYWRYLDVDERSRLEFLFPFYLKSCTPTSDTFVGSFGLWGHRSDAHGSAGYIGPYLYRRDILEQSDVVFPVFWWLRGERDNTFVAGPWYDLERGPKRRFGLVPFYFGGRDDRGGFFDATPVFAQWGDRFERNFWTLQTWGSSSPTAWSVASIPFYWGGVERGGAAGKGDDDGMLGVGGSYYHLIPPLLTFIWGEETEQGPVSRVIIGAYGDFTSPGGSDSLLFPLAIWGEGQALPPDGLTRPTFGRALWETIDGITPFKLAPRQNARFSYQLAPFFLHLEDVVDEADGTENRHDRWAVGPAYLGSTTADGWDAGLIPFWFEGWESDEAAKRRGIDTSSPDQEPFHYRVIPPLLYAHFANGDDRTTYFAQTYLRRKSNAYDFGSIPFYFRGRAPDDDDSWYDHVPLALNFNWGDKDQTSHIIGPGFSFADARGFDHGIFPFYFGGETAPGHQREGALSRFEDFLFDNRRGDIVVDEEAAKAGIPTDHYRVIPPLLFAHFGDVESESTFLAQSYLLRDKSGWDFGSVPFAFFGRRTDEKESFYDVIPPLLFARWGDNDQTQLIAGPWFDFRADSLFGEDIRSRHFGVLPFLVAGRFGAALSPGDLGEVPLSPAEQDTFFRYHFGPGFFHLGFERGDFLLAAQTIALWDDDEWLALSFPFYFGMAQSAQVRPDGGTTAAEYLHIVPPLLTYVGGSDGDRLPSGELDPKAEGGAWGTWITGSFWHVWTERGFDTSLLPLFAVGSVDGGPEGIDETGATDAYRSRPFFSNLGTEIAYNLFGEGAQEAIFGPRNRGFSYHLIPPLAYGHLATATHKRTVFLQSYLSRSDDGYDLGSAPFFFHGRGFSDESNGLYYDVIPPLGFASWGNADETRVLVLQTFFGSEHYPERTLDDGTLAAEADAWRVWSVPFAFFGADDREEADHFYAVIPPLGFAHFGDSKTSNTLVGPYFDFKNPTGRDFGFAPFYLGGEANGGPSVISTVLKENFVAPFLGDTAATELFPDTGHHYRLVPPLLYAHVGDGDQALTLFGSSYLRRSPSGWDAGVFPLAFAGGTTAASDEDFAYAFAPLLLSGFFQEGNNRTTVAGPWFDVHLDIGEEDEFRALGLIPFGGGYWTEDENLFAGPGFAKWGNRTDDHWWVLQTFASDELIHDDKLAAAIKRPLGASTAGQAITYRTRLYSVPFVFFEETRGKWVEPSLDGAVFDPDDPRAAEGEVLSSTLFMPPLLTWAQNDPEGAHLVAGPWFDFENTHGRDFGLVPFYFEGASAGTGRSPLWRWARTLREDLWGYDDEPVEVQPGVFAERELDAEATGDSHYRIIPALAYLHFGDDAMHRTVFGPSWLFDDADGWNAGVLPVYFGRRSTRYGDHDIIPPLFFARWREAKREAGGLIAGPFLAWDAPTYDEAMVLGLFYGGWMTPDARGRVEEGPLTSFVRSLPLGSIFAGERGDDGSWWVAPPFGAHRAHAGGSATFVLQSYWISERNRTDFGSLPFFLHGHEVDDEGKTIGFYDVVPPALFGIWGDEDETNVFALQTLATLSPTKWRVWSAPFYFGGVEELPHDGGGPAPVAYHHLIPLAGTFLWGNDLDATERAIIAPLLTLWIDNPSDSFWLVGPYSRYEDKVTQDFDQALWPVWFNGQKGDSFYNLYLPFAGAWGDSAQQTRFLLTAFETSSANGDYTRAVLPFYYSHRRFKNEVLSSSFDMITPAYWAWGDAKAERRFFAPTLTYSSTVGDEDFLIAPFVYHLDNQAETNTIVFPFYWHFRRAEAGVEIFDAHVASGVWWDFAWPNEGKRLQIAPGYVRYDEPDETLQIAGPFSWTEGKGDNDAAWSFHFFPFFSIWSYHPGHFKWRALLFAAGYEREERDDMPPKEQWLFFGIKTDAE